MLECFTTSATYIFPRRKASLQVKKKERCLRKSASTRWDKTSIEDWGSAMEPNRRMYLFEVPDPLLLEPVGAGWASEGVDESEEQAVLIGARTRMAARGRNTSTAMAAATRAPGDTGMGPPTVESIIADTYSAVENSIDSPGSVCDMS